MLKSTLIFLALIIIASSAFGISPGVNVEQAQQAANNWVSYFISEKGSWGDANLPIVEPGQIIADGSDTLGYYFAVSPAGYIVCPAFNLLPPIKAYSTSQSLDLADENGFAGILREVLQRKAQIIADHNSDISELESAGYNAPGIIKF